MGYVDELLSRQIRLAEQLEAEPEEQAARQIMPRTAQRKAEEPEKEPAARRSGAEEATERNAAQEDGENAAGSREALRALSELQAARARAALLAAAQTQSEQLLRAAQQTQGVTPSQTVYSRYDGGMAAEPVRAMQLAGTASVQTQWSMQEISRFFERDARRYGG